MDEVKSLGQAIAILDKAESDYLKDSPTDAVFGFIYHAKLYVRGLQDAALRA